MRKNCRLLSLFIAAAISASALSGCGSADKKTSEPAAVVPDYLNTEGFPIVKQPIKISVMVANSANQPDFNTIENMKEYEKMTGVETDWINIPNGSANEKISVAFASDALPDAFLKCGAVINNVNQLRFGSDGMIMDLNKNGMLEKYAPNFMKYYNKYDDVKSAVTFPNGAVYSFPQGIESNAVKVAGKTFYNQKWLDKLGMKEPTTTDEFYTLLKAFKDNDMNGNGKKDEIPLSSSNISYIMYALQGAFGLSNRGMHDELVDMDEDSGKPRLMATSNAYKELLQYLNKLYSEGLLDNEIFTMKSPQYVAKHSEGLIGVFNYTNLTTIPSDAAKNFTGATVALKGPHGDQLWTPVRSQLHSTGAFIITKENKYPEATIRWVDYFYSDAGNLFYNFGIEGKTYNKQPDGKYKFVDSVYDQINKGIPYDAAVAPLVPIGGRNPLFSKEPYFYGGEVEPIPAKAANDMVKYFPKDIWPILNFTSEENSELTVVKTDIKNYIDLMTADFITGKKSLSEWDNYVKQINTMGADRLLAIYTKALKRIGKVK
ncbi:MAG: extracellular solute-binding protein [Bacillota bacterium]|nr:extracellular solute-binding protein [Bacillota bacterium]